MHDITYRIDDRWLQCYGQRDTFPRFLYTHGVDLTDPRTPEIWRWTFSFPPGQLARRVLMRSLRIWLAGLSRLWHQTKFWLLFAFQWSKFDKVWTDCGPIPGLYPFLMHSTLVAVDRYPRLDATSLGIQYIYDYICIYIYIHINKQINMYIHT